MKRDENKKGRKKLKNWKGSKMKRAENEKGQK